MFFPFRASICYFYAISGRRFLKLCGANLLSKTAEEGVMISHTLREPDKHRTDHYNMNVTHIISQIHQILILLMCVHYLILQ